MPKYTPSVQSPSTSPVYKQTGPKTPTGKACSSQNAVKHGLTSRSLVLPGEDPQEYDRFVAAIVESFHPKGAAEQELAREVATSMWKLRRTTAWEAAQARLQSAPEQQTRQAQVSELGQQVLAKRSALSSMQRDPASDPPLIVRLATMPDCTVVDDFDVNGMYLDWRKSLPAGVSDIELDDLLERLEPSQEAEQDPSVDCKEDAEDDQDVEDVADDDLNEDGDWTVLQVRELLVEMAKVTGISVETLLRDAELRWKTELPDQRAQLRQRRREIRREITRLEQQQRDLLVEQAMPNLHRLELLNRYESAALRTRDKTLKVLLEVQQRRQRQTVGHTPAKKTKG